jgi:hypothetical protein
MERLIMHDFASAKKVTIILDNFSIVFWGAHKGFSLYEVPAGVLS